jgi:hypothetical protein
MKLHINFAKLYRKSVYRGEMHFFDLAQVVTDESTMTGEFKAI